MAKLPALDWKTAVAWTVEDGRDDFFPDMIRFRDFGSSPDRYLKENARKLLQYSRQQFESYSVPKTQLLKRKAVVLPFPARLVYTALLRQLFPVLAPSLPSGVHSYRQYPELDHDAHVYPYPSASTKRAWLAFKHGFHGALNDGVPHWGAVTDIATFFERISVDRLADTLRDLVPLDAAEDAAGSLDVLRKLLLWCSAQGFGIPQNYDASSFFGTVFLTPVDREMSRLSGVYYSRWMDDIRVAARTRGEVIDALHRLQEELARLGLGLNARKTVLLEPGTADYEEFLTVEKDVELQGLSEDVATGVEARIRKAIPRLVGAVKESDKSGDDRFVRAFGGRLLEAAEFLEVRDECLDSIREVALSGFRVRPERADWWCRFLSPGVSEDVQRELCAILKDPDFNRNEWTNFWAVVTLGRAAVPTDETMDLLRETALRTGCVPARAHAVVALGRMADHTDRRRLGDMFVSGDSPPALRRAALIALQELPQEQRDEYHRRAEAVDPDLADLREYLSIQEVPIYSVYSFPKRRCVAVPPPSGSIKQTGVGFVEGKWTRFSVLSRYFPDYE